MFLTRLAIPATVLLAVSVGSAGTGLFMHPTPPAESDSPNKAARQELAAGADDETKKADDQETEDQARERSQNNLKQILLAMHNYQDAKGHLPAAEVQDKDGKALLSWRVLLLPYLEQNELFNDFKLDEPWDSEHNKKLLARMPKVYAPPRGKHKEHSTVYQVFTGKDMPFMGARAANPSIFPGRHFEHDTGYRSRKGGALDQAG